MTATKKDGRAFTVNSNQAFIFKKAKQIIEGKGNTVGLSDSIRIQVNRIVKRFQDGKIEMKQIEAKSVLIEAKAKDEKGNQYGVIGSRGYKTIENKNYIWKSGNYTNFYIVLPIEAISKQFTIFNVGISSRKYGAGLTSNPFYKNPSKVIARICTHKKCIKEIDGIYYPLDVIDPKDIVSLQYNACLEKKDSF